MKRILFFIASGILTEAARAASEAIKAKWPTATVGMRNGTCAAFAKDSVETCDAVAGLVPKAYAERFPRISLETLEVVEVAPAAAAGKPAAALSLVPPAAPTGNALGLPEGHPRDRDELKAALAAAQVPFHGSLATPKLVDLYRVEILDKSADPGTEGDKPAGE